MKKGITLVLSLAVIAALLGGCFDMSGYNYATPLPSGVTAAPTPTISPEIQPQQLIDRATAETLVGNKLKDMDEVTKDKPNSNPSVGMSFCLYNPVKTGDRHMQINLYRRTETFNQDPAQIYQALKSSMPKATAPVIIATVTGVGDEAYIADPGIHIISQGYYIVISIGDPNIPENQEKLKLAGSMAVENLKKLLGVK